MLSLMRPKYFMPAHGEYRMLKLHAELAQTLGMPADHIFICDNGDVLTLFNHKVARGGHVPAEDVYIDGNDLDGVSSAMMNDRAILKSDGLVTILVAIDAKKKKLVYEPIVYTRGFAASEQAHVVRHSKMRAQEALDALIVENNLNIADAKASIKSIVSKYIERRTGRKPMIVPIVMNVENY